MPKTKPKAMTIREENYPAEVKYVYELAKERGITSKTNALAIIIREHKQASQQPATGSREPAG